MWFCWDSFKCRWSLSSTDRCLPEALPFTLPLSPYSALLNKVLSHGGSLIIKAVLRFTKWTRKPRLTTQALCICCTCWPLFAGHVNTLGRDMPCHASSHWNTVLYWSLIMFRIRSLQQKHLVRFKTPWSGLKHTLFLSFSVIGHSHWWSWSNINYDFMGATSDCTPYNVKHGLSLYVTTCKCIKKWRIRMEYCVLLWSFYKMILKR